MSDAVVNVLLAARRVADLADAEGAANSASFHRPAQDHMGAIVADAVLQAGLNYSSVVRPRVTAILFHHPSADRVSALERLVDAGNVEAFLNWRHPTKVGRFEGLVRFLACSEIETSADLKRRLYSVEFRASLRAVNGIGPKTVDYLACLVGIESIAVDRHVRAYARRAGIESQDYDFLREVFCGAADLLSLSRRAFDGWIWRKESGPSNVEQLALSL